MNIKNRLVWVDLEMTGLNAQKDVILEFALLITDNDLNPVAPGLNYVIHQPANVLHDMSALVHELHTKSGLLDAVAQSTHTLEFVQQKALELLHAHCNPKEAPLCGNSVWQDAAFLRQHMPQFMDYLHYRIIDVSSLKEVIKRWYPHNPHAHFSKTNIHRALQDIEESIAELSWYKKYFFVPIDVD